MVKHTIYVIQEKLSTALELKERVNCGNFEVVGVETDGEKALKDIEENSPEIVLTEVICSGVDGLEVIKRISYKNPNIKTVVVSSVTNEEIISRALELGASYYILKPTNTKILLERLTELVDVEKRDGGSFRANDKHVLTLDEKISKIIISVGIPPHIKGYYYLRDGVKMTVSEPSIIGSITKKLYPKIGEKYGTSASKVERAIRHAIEVAWNRGRIDAINSLFGVKAVVGNEKPTNGEFIALVADKMVLEGM